MSTMGIVVDFHKCKHFLYTYKITLGLTTFTNIVVYFSNTVL